MVKRVDKLTKAQEARFTDWADRWIEIGLRTGHADRQAFETAARKCYEYAGIPWHHNVVWISSPLALAIAAPVAALLIQYRRHVSAGDDAVRGAVDGAVDDAVRGAVGEAKILRKDISKAIKEGWYRYFGGQFWVGGWYWGGAYTSFFREVCNLELKGEMWDRGRAYEQTIQSACWWYPHRDFLMVCERPIGIHRELANPAVQRGWGSHRLHRTDGPAVHWADGWGVYSIHGRQVPGWIIEHPERIEVRHIESETNAEVRRVMIERYGWSRYIADCGAQVVDAVPDTHDIVGLRGARLLSKDLPGEPEPIVYLDMVNSTPEPDGTLKHYLERVDPKAYGGDAGRRCHAAMASRWRYRDDEGALQLTFRRWQDYVPTAES